MRIPTQQEVAERQARARLGVLDRQSRRRAAPEFVDANPTTPRVIVASDLYTTPPSLAQRVVEAADIRDGQRVLEPSAGTGQLVRSVLDTGRNVSIQMVEVNTEMVDHLRDAFPGHKVGHSDFLDFADGLFDRVVMNPPFAKQQDILHVTHALKFLAPGGRLVAIMSAGVGFRQDRRAREFRDLVARHDGNIDKLPEGSFKASGTMVNTVLVTMEVES